MNTKEEILTFAIQQHGCIPQIDMFHEEVGEVLQALNKVKRMGGLSIKELPRIIRPSKEAPIEYCLAYYELCSEVADVRLLLDQLELMLWKEAIDISEERKLQRLKERLLKNTY